MMFSTLDIIILVALIAVVFGSLAWLLVAGRKLDARDRAETAAWYQSYFERGGLARALITRWSSQPRLTDRRNKPSD